MLYDTIQYDLVLIAVLDNGVVSIKLLHPRSLRCLQIFLLQRGNTIWGSVLLALLNIWLLSLKKCCITNVVNGIEGAMLGDNSNLDHHGVRSDFRSSVDYRV